MRCVSRNVKVWLHYLTLLLFYIAKKKKEELKSVLEPSVRKRVGKGRCSLRYDNVD